jgi:hypothetical protein
MKEPNQTILDQNYEKINHECLRGGCAAVGHQL